MRKRKVATLCQSWAAFRLRQLGAAEGMTKKTPDPFKLPLTPLSFPDPFKLPRPL